MRRRLFREFPGVRRIVSWSAATGAASGLLTVVQAELLARIVARAFLGGLGRSELVPLFMALLVPLLLRPPLRFVHEADLGASVRGDRGRAQRKIGLVALDGVDALEGSLLHYLPQTAWTAIVPLIVLAAIAREDRLSAGILVVTAPLVPLFMVLVGRAAETTTRREWDTLRVLGAHFLDVIQGLATLGLFGRSRAQAAEIAHVGEAYRETAMRALRIAFLSGFVLELVASLSTTLVAVAVGLRLLSGTLEFVRAFAVLLLVPEFFLPLRSLGSEFHASRSGLSAFERIFAILDETEPPQPTHRAPLPIPEAARATLRVRSAVLRYPKSLEPALRGLDLAWKPGETIAVVGESGSGKSTLVKLILGFMQPEAGDVLIGGTPLQDLPLDLWRAQVAYVPQTPLLLSGTVAQNLRLGRPDATDADLWRAARLAYAAGFIAALPGKMTAEVGESGRQLSGGERQRIALAHACLRDAPLLVLDEPTASLGPVTDRLVRGALFRLLRRQLGLIIAHRLSTARRADRIVVVHEGHAVETGSHRELLRRGRIYPHLVRSYLEGEGDHKRGNVAPAVR